MASLAPRSVLRPLVLRWLDDVQSIIWLFKWNWSIKLIVFAVQTKLVFNKMDKSTMGYLNSERLVLKLYDWLVSTILYQNPEFNEKSGWVQYILPKRSLLNHIFFSNQTYSDTDSSHNVFSYETIRFWKYWAFFKVIREKNNLITWKASNLRILKIFHSNIETSIIDHFPRCV